MEIQCRKCGTKLRVDNPATPIFKCTSCGYPNPVIRASQPQGAPFTPKPNQPAHVPHGSFSPESAATAGTPFPGVKPQYHPAETPALQKMPELGWLVVHDENAPQQTHPLRIGRQVIGRKSVSKPCDVMIETSDAYMGRNHCIVEVKPNRSGGYEFFLSDVKMNNGIPEQMSTNGTFVNAMPTPLKPKDVVYLHDGDTIQLGQTKVVLKTLKSSATAQDASRIVESSEYMPTVILK